MNQITFTNQMAGEEYNHLRELAGFTLLSTGQAERGLEHTTFLVAARDGEQIVGMGRVLFDFGYTAYIGDVFVHPDYQRKGIGTRIVRKLMRQTLDAACEGDRIMFILGAAKGKEEFYEKLGFLKRPNEISGCGMSLSIVKTDVKSMIKKGTKGVFMYKHCENSDEHIKAEYCWNNLCEDKEW